MAEHWRLQGKNGIEQEKHNLEQSNNDDDVKYVF